MTIYTVITAVYDCDEWHCHDGDPAIYVDSFLNRADANRLVNSIIAKYKSNTDDDGEPTEEFICERTNDGAVCTSESVEAVITIEQSELH